jgi:quercetin dioxygenase-like cupin family protein
MPEVDPFGDQFGPNLRLMNTLLNMSSWRLGAAAMAVVASLAMLTAADTARADESPKARPPLLTRDLAGIPGKEALVLTVEYAPGESSRPHRHDSNVFVYVLEGTITMQVKDGPAVTLHPGQTYYESPSDIHTLSANASKTAPAKFLVFIVKDKGAPVTRALTAQDLR